MHLSHEGNSLWIPTVFECRGNNRVTVGMKGYAHRISMGMAPYTPKLHNYAASPWRGLRLPAFNSGSSKRLLTLPFDDNISLVTG